MLCPKTSGGGTPESSSSIRFTRNASGLTFCRLQNISWVITNGLATYFSHRKRDVGFKIVQHGTTKINKVPPKKQTSTNENQLSRKRLDRTHTSPTVQKEHRWIAEWPSPQKSPCLTIFSWTFGHVKWDMCPEVNKQDIRPNISFPHCWSVWYSVQNQITNESFSWLLWHFTAEIPGHRFWSDCHRLPAQPRFSQTAGWR